MDRVTRIASWITGEIRFHPTPTSARESMPSAMVRGMMAYAHRAAFLRRLHSRKTPKTTMQDEETSMTPTWTQVRMKVRPSTSMTECPLRTPTMPRTAMKTSAGTVTMPFSRTRTP